MVVMARARLDRNDKTVGRSPAPVLPAIPGAAKIRSKRCLGLCVGGKTPHVLDILGTENLIGMTVITEQ